MGSRRGIFVLLAVVLALAWLAGRPPAALPAPPLPAPGDVAARAPAPDWVLADTHGGERTHAEFLGRVVVLNFWATWCAPCRRELPALQALSEALSGEGLAVVAISVDTGATDRIARFAQERGVTFPVLHDPSEEVARRHRAIVWPTTVVIDRAGRVAHHVAGAWDWNAPEAHAALRALLAEAPTAQ